MSTTAQRRFKVERLALLKELHQARISAENNADDADDADRAETLRRLTRDLDE